MNFLVIKFRDYLIKIKLRLIYLILKKNFNLSPTPTSYARDEPEKIQVVIMIYPNLLQLKIQKYHSI